MHGGADGLGRPGWEPASARRDDSNAQPHASDVPTLLEFGLPGFDFCGWHGISVAGKTPPATVERLNKDVQRHLCRPAIKKQWEELGTPENFGLLVRSETEKLGKLMRELASR